MSLSVHRLGSATRPITAICQLPSSSQVHLNGRHFLLCRPIGREGTRTAAMYRVLAEQLSKAGFHVWRFDYFGTGDSSGDESIETINTWAQDLALVHAYICEKAPGEIHWFAMRLATEIATQACLQLSTRLPKRLVLWDPITDGVSYASSLIEGHKNDLVREYRYTWQQLLAQKRVTEPALPDYILGFRYGPGLTEAIRSIKTPAFTQCVYLGIQLTVGCQSHKRSELQSNNPVGVQWLNIEEDTDWLSSEAQGSAIVPRSVLQALNHP